MKKDLKSKLVKYLEREPRARERRNKNRALVNLLQSDHPSLHGVPKDVMTEIVEELLYLDRIWRKVLSDERVDLRGKDYDGLGYKSKRQLEEEAEIEIGYEPGY